jgi:hypothetical protein
LVCFGVLGLCREPASVAGCLFERVHECRALSMQLLGSAIERIQTYCRLQASAGCAPSLQCWDPPRPPAAPNGLSKQPTSPACETLPSHIPVGARVCCMPGHEPLQSKIRVPYTAVPGHEPRQCRSQSWQRHSLPEFEQWDTVTAETLCLCRRTTSRTTPVDMLNFRCPPLWHCDPSKRSQTVVFLNLHYNTGSIIAIV